MHDLITSESNVQLNFPEAFTTWYVLVQSNSGVSFAAGNLTFSCLATKQLTFLNKQLKSTWTQSPHVASNRIFSPCRSPKPRIWPTIHITAEVRQYARRLMYLLKDKRDKSKLAVTYGRQEEAGFMVPDVPCVETGNWGQKCDNLLYHVFDLRWRRNTENGAFFKKFLDRIVPYMFILQKMLIVYGTAGRSTNYLAWKSNKQSSYSFLPENK